MLDLKMEEKLMSVLKKSISAIVCVAICLSCMVAFSACRLTKDETVFTFKSGDKSVDVTAGMYLLALVDAYGAFRTEYDEAVEKASATTSADLDYANQTLESKNYDTWNADKAYESCATYAYVELEFDRLKLELTAEDIANAEYQADYYWNQYGYNTVYEPNGVSYNTYLEYTKNSVKYSKIYDYYYGKYSDKEKKENAELGSLRPSDKEIKKTISENYVIADTISISLTSTDSTSSNVTTLSDEEKKFAKDKLQKYADRINNGETFSKIYIEYNGQDMEESTESKKPKDKYATVYGSDKTSVGNEDYFEDIKKQKIGKAVVLEFSDVYMLVVKQDVLKDSYYYDSMSESAIQISEGENFTKKIEEDSKKLECVKNDGAVKYYQPKKIEYPTTAASAQ